MPKTINEVHLAGHLGRDAETRYTPSGKALTKFSVATGGGEKQGGGKWPTDWHNVIAWGELAERASTLKKGAFVELTGRLQTSSWDDKQTGKKCYKTEIVAAQIVPAEEEIPQTRQERPKSTAVTSSHPITDNDLPDFGPDDIPF